jgi:hypothetical protein
MYVLVFTFPSPFLILLSSYHWSGLRTERQITTTPDPDKSQINALHLKLKTSQLIRSAQSIRDISHELKLMLLLSDQGADVKERDREAAEVGKEVERRRREMGEKVGGMLAGPRPVPQPESGAEARGNREEEGMDVDPVDRDRDVDQDHAVVKEVEADDDTHQEEEDEDEEDEGFEQVA